MSSVTVNMDNLRLKTMNKYNKLVDVLNNAKRKTTEEYGDESFINIDIDDIQEILEDLGDNIVAIGCCFNDSDMSDISDKIDRKFFNEEE